MFVRGRTRGSSAKPDGGPPCPNAAAALHSMKGFRRRTRSVSLLTEAPDSTVMVVLRRSWVANTRIRKAHTRCFDAPIRERVDE